MNISCSSLGNLNQNPCEVHLTEPSRFLSIFSHNYFCFLYKQFYGEWRGGIFLYPFKWLCAQFSGHCGCRVRGRLLHNFSSVGYPMFCGLSFLWGGTGTKVTCCGEPGLFQSTAKSRTFPISPLPCWGGCCTQQSKLGVTNIYQRTQPKRWTVFLGHDPEKWGWVALIRLLLTTTANLTPTSLDCHENWP